MNTLPGMKHDVAFGGDPSAKLPDWRKGKGEKDPDDELLAKTPPDVVAILGFDPAEDEAVTKGEEEGHPFRGNQFTQGESGGEKPSVEHKPAFDDTAKERDFSGLSEKEVAFAKEHPHVFHITPRNNTNSIMQGGLRLSKTGAEGAGVYFATTMEGTQYYNEVGAADSRMFRMKTEDLFRLSHLYPAGKTQLGDDVIVGRKIPADALEVLWNPGTESEGWRLVKNSVTYRKASQKGISVKGEEDGHPFRGNQYTQGQEGGPQDPMSAVSRGSGDNSPKLKAAFMAAKRQGREEYDKVKAERTTVIDQLRAKYDEYKAGNFPVGDPATKSILAEIKALESKGDELTNKMNSLWDDSVLPPKVLVKQKIVADVAGRVKITPEQLETLRSFRTSTDTHVAPDKVWKDLSQDEKVQSVVDGVLSTWAESAADSNLHALGFQKAVAKEFNLPAERIDQRIKMAKLKYGNATDVDPEKQAEALRPFARAMYENTQSRLAADSVFNATLHRGTALASDKFEDFSNGSLINYRGNPISSWTFNREMASEFIGQFDAEKDAINTTALILSGHVPARSIFSTALTGVGCLGEDEVVVLGRPGKVRAHINE